VEISRITVERSPDPLHLEGQTGSRTAAVIEDRERIGRVVEFLRSRDRGWQEHGDTFPVSEYRVILHTYGGDTTCIYDCGDLFGAPVGGRKRLRRMTRGEVDEFRSILGLPQAR
jgi:hypothetical protein